VDQLSPLVLAYVGDAVYELFVRTHLLRQEARVGDLHLAARELVRAATQARILRSLEPELREEEKRVARRGRNTKSGSIPKSATVSEYRHATGFECLLGYLFLTGQDDRLLELLTRAVEVGQGPGDGMEAEG
jgi:ribonuclease-3 family protein